MHVFIIVSLVLIFVLGLIHALLSVFQDLAERIDQSGPVFRDSGPIFYDQGASPQARSQFAWQSRSHFREPD